MEGTYMTSFYIILLCIFLAFLGFSMYIGGRNKKVYEFMMNVLDDVSAAAQFDISQGKEWDWRYRVLAEVEYTDVLFSVKPLKVSSFWPDDSFTRF
jgi:hypothetical protein